MPRATRLPQRCQRDGGIQKIIAQLLRNRGLRWPEVRMRQRLEHWDLPLYPRLRASRAVGVLRRLSRLVPPRIVAAVLRTLWSGWCTARRFGRRADCLFCKMQEGDYVEHVSICPVIARFGRGFLRLPYQVDPSARRLSFFLLEPASQLVDDVLILGSLRLAAAYRLHCLFRRSSSVLQVGRMCAELLSRPPRSSCRGARLQPVSSTTDGWAAETHRRRIYDCMPFLITLALWSAIYSCFS